MPFIGNQPAEKYSAFQKQDFSTSATTSYTLDHPVSNQNEIALFINFVRQEPTAAYTASGTTLTLTSATSSSDDMYCVYLGKAVQTVNPPNGSVGTAQLADSSVTSAKLSGITQGITEADMWVTNADQTLTASTVTLVSGNWQRFTAITDKIGTGMSESSGVWTFPSTGIWFINAKSDMYADTGAIDFGNVSIYTTTDNSSYTERTNSFNSTSTSGHYLSTNQFITFDVTSTSTHKIKLYAYSRDVTGYLRGNADKAETSIYFIRLGDT